MWVSLVTRTKAELLVLAQLGYWFGVPRDPGGRHAQPTRARITEEGYYWVRKTHRQLADEVGLTRDQVIAALKSLKRAGLVIRYHGGQLGEISHYRLDPIAIEKALPPDWCETGVDV